MAFDRGFLFADGVYEVMRTYNRKIFKIDEHKKRLANSLKEIRINNFNAKNVEEIIKELVSMNNLDNDFNVYLQITRGAPSPRMHAFPLNEINPTVYVMLYPLISSAKENENGIKDVI